MRPPAKYKWHFQTIHHDIWDADPPAAPGLIDITVSGKKVHALAEVTKSGWMFILDRETGKPVFGVEERAVPKSDVPGEATWPTQPFPLKPPPLARVSFKPEDLVTAADTTAEHAQACRELVEKNGRSVQCRSFHAVAYIPRGRRSWSKPPYCFREELAAAATGAAPHPILRSGYSPS